MEVLFPEVVTAGGDAVVVGEVTNEVYIPGVLTDTTEEAKDARIDGPLVAGT